MDNREFIARRVAREFTPGSIVNLGIGMPTLVANYVDPSQGVILQSENGFVGLGPAPSPGDENPDIVNAGGMPVTILPGGACFDSAQSFAMIRGGHIDACVLGALQVDEEGNLANWMIPGKLVPGMGGAMDLVVGAQRVIVAMEHMAKGAKKILKRCTLPLTAKAEVNLIVTEMCVIEVMKDGLMLRERNFDYTIEQLLDSIEARLVIPDDVVEMRV